MSVRSARGLITRVMTKAVQGELDDLASRLELGASSALGPRPGDRLQR
jgi:hypothetical protein